MIAERVMKIQTPLCKKVNNERGCFRAQTYSLELKVDTHSSKNSQRGMTK
jgi:hypothetical protein